MYAAAKSRLCKMWSTDVAWLAGLYEGEGSLVYKVDARNGAETWELSITMTDEDVIERIATVTGIGTSHFTKRAKPDWSDQYRWRIGRRADIHAVLLKIAPHLGKRRRARAQEFFDWYVAHTPHASRLTRDA